MFLIERLVGVGTFTIILLFVCFLISICKSNRGVRFVLFLYTIVLSIMGFFYVPYVTADLYRIYGFLDLFKTFDFNALWDRYQDSSSPIAYIYYWLVSKTGENRLLPAITAFVCFSCIFYIIGKTAKIYDISRKNTALSVFFIMSVGFYLGMISGIRSTLAICLIAYCFFRETVEKKFRIYHIFIYVFAALIHNFAVVIIIIRLTIPFFVRSTKPWKKVAYTVFLCILSIFIVRNVSELLGSVFEKAKEYITGNLYSYGWGYLINSIIIFTAIYFLKNLPKLINSENGNLKQTKIFSIVLIIIALVFCFEYSIFARTSNVLLPIVSIPCLMVSLEKSKNLRVFNTVLILSMVIMILSFTRGSMCSYKFFVL